MRIYCDMDDILCETALALCGLAQRLFGRTTHYEEMHDFNLQTSFRLTEVELKQLMDVAHSTDFLLSYAPTEGAVAALHSLRTAGHVVDIVTGRPATSHRGTEGWLAAMGLGDFPVIYVNKYGRLFVPDGDAPEMVPLAQLLETPYDVVIDDSPVVLPAFKEWTDSKVLVFDRPWNQNFVLAANMKRVKGWADILRNINC